MFVTRRFSDGGARFLAPYRQMPRRGIAYFGMKAIKRAEAAATPAMARRCSHIGAGRRTRLLPCAPSLSSRADRSNRRLVPCHFAIKIGLVGGGAMAPTGKRNREIITSRHARILPGVRYHRHPHRRPAV